MSFLNRPAQARVAALVVLLAGGACAAASPPAAAPATAGLDPATILRPLADAWPTYSGDYSGRRYSALKQVNQGNVQHLTLAWAARVTAGEADKGSYPRPTGGNGTADIGSSGRAGAIRGSPLMVDGVLYVSMPDNAWAIDARDGRILWHYFWKTKGGTHIGNRGLGMWGHYLYMETPDDYLVSLDARTGEERWNVPIANFDEQYFSTTAPVVVGNHVLVGTGNDLDAPGYLQSFDPETGALQWKFYTVPMKEGDPGLETWKNLDAARHGGGNPWVPGSYDPDTHLYIIGTGNPTPSYFAAARGNGDALYTCSLVAVNVDTGKMAWYYQTSPNDTHDWDSAQTPVLADVPFNGRTRKVAMTAARNGYFFMVDRTTGEHLVTGRFSDTVNWAEDKVDAHGHPVRIPAKDSDVGGALVSSSNPGATNWPPPSYSPDYGLFFLPVAESWSMYYLSEMDPRGAMGLGGMDELSLSTTNYLKAIDPKTGKVAWKLKYPSSGGGGSGMLTTAGRLLFSGDPAGNLVARDPASGKPLWHTHLGSGTNAPETFLVDGQQYIVAASGDTLFAFKLY